MGCDGTYFIWSVLLPRGVPMKSGTRESVLPKGEREEKQKKKTFGVGLRVVVRVRNQERTVVTSGSAFHAWLRVRVRVYVKRILTVRHVDNTEVPPRPISQRETS